MEKTQKTLTIQLIMRIAIFAIFFLGVFIKVPSFLLYLIIPLILANLILGFINQRRSIMANILLIVFYPLLFLPLGFGYIATPLGSIVSFIHVLLFYLKAYKQDIKPKKK